MSSRSDPTWPRRAGVPGSRPRPPGEPVFGNLTTHTNLLIQSDLARAGIPYRDDSGRVADFHALRHSYVTALAISPAPVKVVQSLARHSTPTQTLGIYAHVGLFDQTIALDALPGQAGPDAPKTEAGRMAATGTDGPISEPLSLHLPYGGDGTRRDLAGPGEIQALESGRESDSSAERNPRESGPLDGPCRIRSGTVGSGGGGIRTHGGCDTSTVFKTVPIGHSGTPPEGSDATGSARVQWPTSSMISSAT